MEESRKKMAEEYGEEEALTKEEEEEFAKMMEQIMKEAEKMEK